MLNLVRCCTNIKSAKKVKFDVVHHKNTQSFIKFYWLFELIRNIKKKLVYLPSKTMFLQNEKELQKALIGLFFVIKFVFY